MGEERVVEEEGESGEEEDGGGGGEEEGCGELGEAGWKRHVVVRDLKSGVEDDATAYRTPKPPPTKNQNRSATRHPLNRIGRTRNGDVPLRSQKACTSPHSHNSPYGLKT